MPPSPITVSLSRIFIHGEVGRGEVLVALNEKLGILTNGKLVECGSALPPTLTESMDIPRVCMTTYQWALANADRAFWDYGVPLLCVGALGVGILFLKKAMDYVDNVGVITIEPESFSRAQARVNVEREMKEEKFRISERGEDIYIGPNTGDQMRPSLRRWTKEELREHHANFNRESRAKEDAYRQKLEKEHGIAGDTPLRSPQPKTNSPQEVVSTPSFSQQTNLRHRADQIEAVLASNRLAGVRIKDANASADEITFTGTIRASADNPITEDDILEHAEHLEMTQGTSGGIWVKIVGKVFRIILRR